MPSSVIRRFDYRAEEAQLDIEFVSGRRYAYHDVPADEAEAMHAAVSTGEYFNAHIRDHYAFSRLR